MRSEYLDMCCREAPFAVEALGETGIKIDTISSPSFTLQRNRQYFFEGDVRGLSFWVQKDSKKNPWLLDKGRYFKLDSAHQPQPRLSVSVKAFLSSGNFDPDRATVLVRYARRPPGCADLAANPELLPGGYLKFVQARPA